MAYGLELYDAAGNPTLTIQDRVGFFIGKLTGSVAANSTLNVSVAGINSTTTKAIINTIDDLGVIPLQVTVGTNVVSITNGNSFSMFYSVLLVRFT